MEGIIKVCILIYIFIGMSMEGLFRVPGPAAYTEELAKGFEEGEQCRIS